MDKKTMDSLRAMLCEEIESIAKKGNLTHESLDILKDLIETEKNLGKIEHYDKEKEESMALAAKILIEHFNIVADLNAISDVAGLMSEKKVDTIAKTLETPIEEIEFSVRAYNCLKRAGIHTVQDLINKREIEVTKILSSVFNALLNNASFKKAFPSNYRLFQIADLLCTFELIRIKSENKSLSKHELFFFGKESDLRRNYIKKIFAKEYK